MNSFGCCRGEMLLETRIVRARTRSPADQHHLSQHPYLRVENQLLFICVRADRFSPSAPQKTFPIYFSRRTQHPNAHQHPIVACDIEIPVESLVFRDDLVQRRTGHHATRGRDGSSTNWSSKEAARARLAR